MSELKKEGMKLLMEYVNTIKLSELRTFTIECLRMAPKYFWVIPASKSGYYHPPFANGKGGLVKHTYFAQYLFNELKDTYKFDDIDFSFGMCAVTLHDSIKQGFSKKDPKIYDIFHANFPRVYYKELRKTLDDEIPTAYDMVMSLIETHMGDINSGDWSYGGDTQPKSELAKAIHLADYIASRRDLRLEKFL